MKEDIDALVEGFPTALILARSSNNILGVNGAIPWFSRKDLARFKAITMRYKNVVMGRKTYESLHGPLLHRNNLIVTTTMKIRSRRPSVNTVKWLIPTKFICIGGAQLAKTLIEKIDTIYLSTMYQAVEGGKDTVLFNPELLYGFTLDKCFTCPDHVFEIYKRN